MKLTKKTICCITASLMLTAAGFAAEKDHTPAKDAAAKETTATQDAAKAHFPELSHQFEPVAEGIKVTHDFVIQNKGTALLKINQVRTG